MKNIEKAYESAIKDMQDSLVEVYKKGFEDKAEIQELIRDTESFKNHDYIKMNDMNGVDYCYDTENYFDLEGYEDLKRGALVNYLQDLNITVNEVSMFAFTSTCEEIFFNREEKTVTYSPTNETFSYDDEFQAFVWANYKCEEHGIYGGFYLSESCSGKVSPTIYFDTYAKFWDLIKSYPSGRIKRILKEVLDAQMNFNDATFMVVTGELNK